MLIGRLQGRNGDPPGSRPSAAKLFALLLKLSFLSVKLVDLLLRIGQRKTSGVSLSQTLSEDRFKSEARTHAVFRRPEQSGLLSPNQRC